MSGKKFQIDKVLGNPLTQTFLATATIFLLLLGTVGIANIKEFKNTNIDNYIRKMSQEWTFYERLLLSAIPVLLYLIFSRRISGFKAGSFEIQFTQVYQEPVFYKDIDVEIEWIPVDPKEKKGLDQLPKIIQKFSASKDKIPVLTINTDIKKYYRIEILIIYLETLIKYCSLRYVVFTRNHLFQRYIDAKQLLYNLKCPVRKDREVLQDNLEEGKLIIDYMEKGELENIQGASKRCIYKYFSNKQALTRMKEWKTSELAVIDDQGKLVGFTNKETIAASILNDLVK